MTVRVHIPIPLRWGDLDAYNHVNNVTMMRILEESRIRAFWTPEVGDALPTAVIKAAAGSDTITMIAGHLIEYLAPVEYHRDPLDVQLWIGRFGGASADVCYEVYSEGELVVRAESTMVFIDAATGRPRRISVEERAAWEPYSGPPIVFKRDATLAAKGQ
ncbi:MAG TPA: thioesterase family protein [Terrimesophilobacter sp.]|uniref:acyl-CoA thioesterase n=1 Tax=Terrimesophilobacter sp. TaxID=2906435 RepID=UPI002F94EA72